MYVIPMGIDPNTQIHDISALRRKQQDAIADLIRQREERRNTSRWGGGALGTLGGAAVGTLTRDMSGLPAWAHIPLSAATGYALGDGLGSLYSWITDDTKKKVKELGLRQRELKAEEIAQRLYELGELEDPRSTDIIEYGYEPESKTASEKELRMGRWSELLLKVAREEEKRANPQQPVINPDALRAAGGAVAPMGPTMGGRAQ